MGLASRLTTGPLPADATIARSLEFLEAAVAAVFLLLLARAIR